MSKKSIVTGKIFEKAYSNANYKIMYNKKNTNNICAIYFSSSGIYYPNSEEQLEMQINVNDRYEWIYSQFLYVRKHIFVRDVAKQFYITGINNDINTIDKLIDLLKKETEGYEIYTIGCSAGGYMATLVGVLMHARRIFSFSGYFNLNILDKDIWFYIKKYDKDYIRSKYFDLTTLINKFDGWMFYFYPTKLKGDCVQSEYFNPKSNRMLKIPIKSKNHGIPMSKKVARLIMNLSDEDKIIDLVNRIQNHSSLYINIIVFGLFKGISTEVKDLLKKIKIHFFNK